MILLVKLRITQILSLFIYLFIFFQSNRICLLIYDQRSRRHKATSFWSPFFSYGDISSYTFNWLIVLQFLFLGILSSLYITTLYLLYMIFYDILILLYLFNICLNVLCLTCFLKDLSPHLFVFRVTNLAVALPWPRHQRSNINIFCYLACFNISYID